MMSASTFSSPTSLEAQAPSAPQYSNADVDSTFNASPSIPTSQVSISVCIGARYHIADQAPQTIETPEIQLPRLSELPKPCIPFGIQHVFPLSGRYLSSGKDNDLAQLRSFCA